MAQTRKLGRITQHLPVTVIARLGEFDTRGPHLRRGFFSLSDYISSPPIYAAYKYLQLSQFPAIAYATP